MNAKRKPTYEQAVSLERGRAVARRNQRERTAARETAPAALPEHEHRYGDWTCRGVSNGHEKRYCECGAFQSRKFTL